MAKNQLFKVIPDRNFVVELLNLYGIKDFYDTHYFTVANLKSLNTLEKLIDITDRLKEYYIPKKHDKLLKVDYHLYLLCNFFVVVFNFLKDPHVTYHEILSCTSSI